MSEKNTKQAASFLTKEDESLSSLYQKIAKLKRFNEALVTYLQPHQQQVCQVANINQQRLIILAANSSIATELRLLTHDLLIKIKANPLFADIREIQVKVSPHPYSPRKRRAKQPVALLSKESAAMIEEIAASISDEKLRKALQKLAKNRKD